MSDQELEPVRFPVLERRTAQPATKVAFASAHSVVDFSNGAAVATLDVLHGLTAFGFNCQAFCTSKLDFEREVRLEEIVADLHEPYQIRDSLCGAERARVLYTRRHSVPITVMRLGSSRHANQSPGETEAVLGFFQKFLDTFAPDVLITYGGDPTTQGMIALAKRQRVPVVFMIHNFGYSTPRAFSNVDYCIVASEFAREQYRNKVGLACQTLPYAIDWDRVRASDPNPRFVTFVNPCLEKGVYAFARIADELGRRRPDIPLLVVESRGTRDTLAACGIDSGAHGNIQFMPHTTDCRQFWNVTKIALLPSLWWENQPLIAIEAMINGIPVIGSDRGGIPETLGQSGFAIALPARLTHGSHTLPTAGEIEPWVETIIRLWDDQAFYDAESAKAKTEAERWHPDRVRPLYADFFRNAHVQRGPPVVLKREGAAAVSSQSAAANMAERPRPRRAEVPMSFVVCVSDDAILKANLLNSPGLVGPDSPHEVILIHKVPSAGAGLNMGLERAKHEWVVCLHQDVYLPEGWDQRVIHQLREAELRFGRPGVAGVYGVGPPKARQFLGAGQSRRFARDQARKRSPAAVERIGWVVDRGRMLHDGPELPARVTALDELLLVVPRDTPLRFDPELGFHFYGADVCLQAQDHGLPVVALGALCHHSSQSVGLPESFFSSAAVFARKWAHRLPVATPCVVIQTDGEVVLLGNAEENSIAYAM